MYRSIGLNQRCNNGRHLCFESSLNGLTPIPLMHEICSYIVCECALEYCNDKYEQGFPSHNNKKNITIPFRLSSMTLQLSCEDNSNKCLKGKEIFFKT